MSWKTITEADVLTVLSGPELAAYRSKAIADGQADPLEPTITQVVDLVRGHVGACARNVLGEGASIPEKLLAPALDLIAVRLPQRVGINPKEGRREAAARAFEILTRVASCEFDIAPPETPSSEPRAGATPRIAARPFEFTRQQQEGI